MQSTKITDRDRRYYEQLSSLDDKYRAIGISAVAAAVRFKTPEPKNPLYTPVYPREEE